MPTRTVTRLVSRNRGAEWASPQNADVAAARLPTRTASLQALFPIEAHERPESTLRAGVATAATVPLTQINDYQSLRCRATHKRPHQRIVEPSTRPATQSWRRERLYRHAIRAPLPHREHHPAEPDQGNTLQAAAAEEEGCAAEGAGDRAARHRAEQSGPHPAP